MKQKVAIWGSYHNGNFGDDLMAIMMAEQLAENGYEPVVFRLDQQLAAEHKVRTVETLIDLLEGALCCIIGGGAFLVGNELSDSFYCSLLRDLDDLTDAANARRISVIGVSVGGGGEGGVKRIPLAVERLIRSPIFAAASVRLPEDPFLLPPTGKEIIYYPDVVLTASRFLAKHRKSTVPENDVLVQHHASPKAAALFYPASTVARLAGRRIRFVQTQLRRYGNAELGSRCSSTVKYETLTGLLEALASTRIVVTCKLHVGVAATSLGRCFVSLGGLPKTQAFLRTIHRPEFYYTKSNALEVVALLFSKQKANDFEQRFRMKKLDELIQAASLHFDFMLKHVRKIERS